MRVKVLTNLGTNEFPPYLEGEELDVDDDLGAKLVRRKLATDITPPVIQAVPAEPVITAPAEDTVETATKKLKEYRAKQLKQTSK